MHTPHYDGIDLDQLAAALDDGHDHGGNPIVSFVDEEGGWPLRCCLANAAPGDEIAIIAWSPFPWTGAYAETGPIVVHTRGCPGPTQPGQLPAAFDSRPMTIRPYGPDRMIAYHHVRHVPAGESVRKAVEAVLAEPDVSFVHGRNATGGCYAFTAVQHQG